MKKSLYIFASALFAIGISSCNDEPESNIDDFELNYEITEVKATSNIPVGCMIVNPAADFNNNAGRWDRLIQEYNPAEGKIGPYVKPVAGLYSIMGSAEDEQDEHARQIGRIVEEMKRARIDFLITPATRENKKLYPDNINRDDSLFLNIISGRNKDLAWHNDGSMKFAIQVNMQNFASGAGFGNYSSVMEDRPNEKYTSNGVTVELTQKERFLSYIRNLAKYMNDDTYYRTAEGRPVIYLREPDKFYVREVKSLYDDIRQTIIDVCGSNPYIICSMPQWTIAPRYSYTVLPGEPDAMSPRNMANYGNSMERYYIWDILHNENFKYNVEYLHGNHPKTDFIPSVSNAYCPYVYQEQYNRFDAMPNAGDLRKRCWIAKMNMGNMPMVIIDCYNEWSYGNFIEPSDPEYGNGVGDEYLDIIRNEFKVN